MVNKDQNFKLLNKIFMNHSSHFEALFEHWQITNSNKIMSLKRLLSCI